MEVKLRYLVVKHIVTFRHSNLNLTNETGPGKADSFAHVVLTGDGRRKIVFNFQRGLTDMQVRDLEKDLKELNYNVLR